MDACLWSRTKGFDLLFYQCLGGNTVSCRFSQAGTSSLCLRGVVLGCSCIRGGGEPGAAREVGEEFLP